MEVADEFDATDGDSAADDEVDSRARWRELPLGVSRLSLSVPCSSSAYGRLPRMTCIFCSSLNGICVSASASTENETTTTKDDEAKRGRNNGY